MNSNWIEFNELENALDNLEMVSHVLKFEDTGKRWKWAIIALHQALYGFAISAVRGTDGRNLIKTKRDRLIDVWEAIDKAKDPKRMPWSHSIPLVTTPDEDWAIRKLVGEFRNGFEHFRPHTWVIEISGMPLLFQHVIRVIEFLALESNCITYLQNHQELRVRSAVDDIKHALNNIETPELHNSD